MITTETPEDVNDKDQEYLKIHYLAYTESKARDWRRNSRPEQEPASAWIAKWRPLSEMAQTQENIL